MRTAVKLQTLTTEEETEIRKIAVSRVTFAQSDRES